MKKKRIILITGGNKGIGAACVQLCLSEGMNVAVLDIDNTSALPDEVYYQVCNVADEAQVAESIRNVINRFGAVDALVNNAGIQRYGSVTETSSDQWDEVMNVNLKSMFLTARYVLPYMQAQRSGIIINVSSVQAFHSQPKVAAYTTAKTAILGLTRSIAVDYAPHIRCIAICPGTVDTPMLRNAIELSPDPAAVLKECEDMHLLRRIAQPEEIAELIVFLCNNKAAFITGQAIRTDGGLGVMIQGSKKD
ncbi:MAG: SDR family oxidoreductase [Chitinophagaceae bacterium]|nr:SDR family oxidoreductase [Chitinophagaceae bacterium]